MSREATFDKYFDSRGTSIYVPTGVLEHMGLPTDPRVIKDAEPYVHVQLFCSCSRRTAGALARSSVSGCCPGRVFIGQYKETPFTRATCRFACALGGLCSSSEARQFPRSPDPNERPYPEVPGGAQEATEEPDRGCGGVARSSRGGTALKELAPHVFEPETRDEFEIWPRTIRSVS